MPPLHIHDREEETFYVVEGQLTLFVAAEEIVLTAGQAVVAPRGVMHVYRVDSEHRPLAGDGFARRLRADRPRGERARAGGRAASRGTTGRPCAHRRVGAEYGLGSSRLRHASGEVERSRGDAGCGREYGCRPQTVPPTLRWNPRPPGERARAARVAAQPLHLGGTILDRRRRGSVERRHGPSA